MENRPNRSQSKRQRHGTAQTSEFTACLFIFLLVTLVPLINLISIAFTVGVVNFGASVAANRMATADTYGRGENSVREITDWLNRGPGAILVSKSLIPVNIYLLRTNITTGAVEHLGPNVWDRDSADPNTYVYEYMITAEGNAPPLLPIKLPLLAGIPGIGANYRVRARYCAAVEHLSAISNSDLKPSWGAGGSGPNGRPSGFWYSGLAGNSIVNPRWQSGLP